MFVSLELEGLCFSLLLLWTCGEVLYGKTHEGAQYYDIYTDIYEQIPEPVPEGLQEDIGGTDVLVNTKYGQIVGKRRTETILTGLLFL